MADHGIREERRPGAPRAAGTDRLGSGDFFRDHSRQGIRTEINVGAFDSRLDLDGQRLVVTVRLAWKFGALWRDRFGHEWRWSSQRRHKFKEGYRRLILDKASSRRGDGAADRSADRARAAAGRLSDALVAHATPG